MDNQVEKAIIFSDHANYKIDALKELGVFLSRDFIESVVVNPDKVLKGYAGRLVAEKEYDGNRTIRVVYDEKKDSIIIITVYPARKERYD